MSRSPSPDSASGKQPSTRNHRRSQSRWKTKRQETTRNKYKEGTARKQQKRLSITDHLSPHTNLTMNTSSKSNSMETHADWDGHRTYYEWNADMYSSRLHALYPVQIPTGTATTDHRTRNQTEDKEERRQPTTTARPSTQPPTPTQPPPLTGTPRRTTQPSPKQTDTTPTHQPDGQDVIKAVRQLLNNLETDFQGTMTKTKTPRQPELNRPHRTWPHDTKTCDFCGSKYHLIHNCPDVLLNRRG